MSIEQLAQVIDEAMSLMIPVFDSAALATMTLGDVKRAERKLNSEAAARAALAYLGIPEGAEPAAGCIGRVAALLKRARAQGNQTICIDAIARELGLEASHD